MLLTSLMNLLQGVYSNCFARVVLYVLLWYCIWMKWKVRIDVIHCVTISRILSCESNDINFIRHSLSFLSRIVKTACKYQFLRNSLFLAVWPWALILSSHWWYLVLIWIFYCSCKVLRETGHWNQTFMPLRTCRGKIRVHVMFLWMGKAEMQYLVILNSKSTAVLVLTCRHSMP